MKAKKNRRPIVAGNWKMNKTVSEAEALIKDLVRDIGDFKSGMDVVLCPPFTVLSTASNLLSGTRIGLGGQNMHFEKSGAFTGEISAEMLRELYCHYVIVGHSERRAMFQETDETVNKKIKAALASHLQPIMCVGETLEQREQGIMKDVIGTQVRNGLNGIGAEDMKNIILAYEPVWAIGTGKTATPEQAQEVHALIRGLLAEISDEETSETIRIQYGGSVKPNNAAELFGQPDIDGGLIGGAALDAGSFLAIVNAAL